MCNRLQLTLMLCLIVTVAAGQSPYTDSILWYQHTYKIDLFPVINKDTAAVRFYPVDPSYRVVASVEKLVQQPFFPMATSDNRAKDAVKYARVTFTLLGKEYTLYAYQLSVLLNSNKNKDNFFIPFTDGTSGHNSYGGGKYIDFMTGNITPGNRLVIDFNKSYNPYCAFRTGYSCPIPPKENELPVEIKAGEMNFLRPAH